MHLIYTYALSLIQYLKPAILEPVVETVVEQITEPTSKRQQSELDQEEEDVPQENIEQVPKKGRGRSPGSRKTIERQIEK